MSSANTELEEALEEALKRIQGDSNESDEDSEELVSTTGANIHTTANTTTTDEVQSRMRLLCLPHKTRNHSGGVSVLKFHREAKITVRNTRDSVLSKTEFCHRVYERLEALSKERVSMRQRAQDYARQEGKSYNEIMSLEWSDSPDYVNKYITIGVEEEKITHDKDRQPSCSDSGLGISYISQSYSDLISVDYSSSKTADSASYYGSSDRYTSVSDSFIKPRVLTGFSRPPLSNASISSHCQSAIHSTTSMSNQSYVRHQSALLPSSNSSSSCCSSSLSSHQFKLFVAYTIEGSKNIFGKRLITQSHSLTLRQFKDMVFARKGSYRFFFKSYCVELNDAIFEEVSMDSQLLPLYEGKIISHVEKM